MSQNNENTLEALYKKRGYSSSAFLSAVRKLDTKCERRIRHMSGVLRTKQNWIEKLNNPDIRGRWETEAKEQGLTDAEIAYVFDELAYYATLHTPGSGVMMSAVEQVWVSDSLIPDEVEKELLRYVAILEDVPDSEIDWHPKSNDQVRNLVHPSLYPLIYAKTSFVETPIESPEAALNLTTFGNFPGNVVNWDNQVRKAYPMTAEDAKYRIYPYSVTPNSRASDQKFCWLPSEFLVAEGGVATIKSYINNLHPVKHAKLYPTIAMIFGKFVPLLENVITDALYTREQRVVPDYGNWLVADGPEPEDYDAGDFDERYEQWEESKRFIEPQPGAFTTPERPTTPFSLRGRRLQAIVKMANIELTPENPKYEGGSWHVEALTNERIIATGIYYYDVENITESNLAFREMVDEEIDYEQSDQRGLDLAYGIFSENNTEGERDDFEIPISQEIGNVVSQKGRCIVFPNTYQHRVSGFELADPTKPGYRKILAFFFIDPVHPIVSTEIVPPQQQSWWSEKVLDVPRIGKLPLVVTDSLFKHVDFPISLENAKEIRLELMAERTATNNSHGSAFFTPSFNFCEH